MILCILTGSTLRKLSEKREEEKKKADSDFILKLTELLDVQIIQMEKNQTPKKIFN